MTGAELPRFVPGLDGLELGIENTPRFDASGSRTRQLEDGRTDPSLLTMPCERSADCRDVRAGHLLRPGYAAAEERPPPHVDLRRRESFNRYS